MGIDITLEDLHRIRVCFLPMRLLFLIFLSVAAVAQNVDDSSSGFEQQYRPAVEAIRAGDVDAAKRAFESFALPDEWFQQTFGASGEALRQQYRSEFDYFQYAETRRIRERLSDTGTQFQAEIRSQPVAPSPAPKPTPASLQPLPSVEGVTIKVFKEPSPSPSSLVFWGSSFVYVNGAFRFFGVGGDPFWNPTRLHRADMCDPNGRQPGGQLIDAVTPSYPDEAGNKGVQGVVYLRLNIATDGSVSSVEVTNGDPLLAQ